MISCLAFLLWKVTEIKSEPSQLKTLFFIWLKKNSNLGRLLNRFHLDLGVNAGFSLKLGKISLSKYYLIPILLQNYSKHFLSSGSLILFWVEAKSSPFSRKFISISVKTFGLTSETVSEQKYLTTTFTNTVSLRWRILL